jgi:hypothetical protein
LGALQIKAIPSIQFKSAKQCLKRRTGTGLIELL